MLLLARDTKNRVAMEPRRVQLLLIFPKPFEVLSFLIRFVDINATQVNRSSLQFPKWCWVEKHGQSSSLFHHAPRSNPWFHGGATHAGGSTSVRRGCPPNPKQTDKLSMGNVLSVFSVSSARHLIWPGTRMGVAAFFLTIKNERKQVHVWNLQPFFGLWHLQWLAFKCWVTPVLIQRPSLEHPCWAPGILLWSQHVRQVLDTLPAVERGALASKG